MAGVFLPHNNAALIFVYKTYTGIVGDAASILATGEREVLRPLVGVKDRGNSFIAARTIEGHRREIMRKMQFDSFVNLVHYAVRNGINQP